MTARITFRSEIFIDGDNMEDIVNKWQLANLFDEDVAKFDPEVVELVSVEEEDTCKDLMPEFIEAC